jgi:hypothetical protein
MHYTVYVKASIRDGVAVAKRQVTEIYKQLGVFLSDEVIAWIQASNHIVSPHFAGKLLKAMLISAQGYGEAFNAKSAVKIHEFLEMYSIIACQNYCIREARDSISALKKFTRFMISVGAFSDQPLGELNTTLKTRVTTEKYEYYKLQNIPAEHVGKFNLSFKLPSNEPTSTKPSPALIENFEAIEKHLNGNIYYLILSFISSCSKSNRELMIASLARYIIPLKHGFNNKNSHDLPEIMSYIVTHTARLMKSLTTFNTCLKLYIELIEHLVNNDYLKKNILICVTTVLRSRNQVEYNKCKLGIIPEPFLNSIPRDLNADEEFETILASTCTPEIAQRLKEHVNSFKNKKHHREPLVAFLKQISLSHEMWYQHPRIVQGELIKFRGDLLDNYQRNTAYGKFQKIKNSISVLIDHGLLPNNIELPNNLRRDTNTEKIRDENPLISNTNLYDEKSIELFSDSKVFIEHIEQDIENNLRLLVSYARTIVHDAYKKFCDASNLTAHSEYGNFILPSDSDVGHEYNEKMLLELANSNAFSSHNIFRLENIVAYFSKNYDKLSYRAELNKENKIALSQDALPYLGLTITTASAMQIIITEEIGINPHSLYSAKVFSTGFGVEFIQVDDDGSVRLRTIKPRARHARIRKALGNLTPLGSISIQDIDAATCLKMAIEMTSKAREVEIDHRLWLCMTTHGITKSSPGDFQRGFQLIRNQVAQDSKVNVINEATLKKVRTSTGVLIYIKSNGDSLLAATYLGNSVKTTLNRYIPKYLTELLYRLKIRSFQRILLFMAIANDDCPFESANVSELQFKKQLKSAFSNPEMGGNLFNKLTGNYNDNDMEEEIYFCVSEKNLQLAIIYAQEGEDEKLKKMCADVINIVSHSNTPLKLLLRKAQKLIS